MGKLFLKSTVHKIANHPCRDTHPLHNEDNDVNLVGRWKKAKYPHLEDNNA
jgi:hypothetical protein